MPAFFVLEAKTSEPKVKSHSLFGDRFDRKSASVERPAVVCELDWPCYPQGYLRSTRCTGRRRGRPKRLCDEVIPDQRRFIAYCTQIHGDYSRLLVIQQGLWQKTRKSIEHISLVASSGMPAADLIPLLSLHTEFAQRRVVRVNCCILVHFGLPGFFSGTAGGVF